MARVEITRRADKVVIVVHIGAADVSVLVDLERNQVNDLESVMLPMHATDHEPITGYGDWLNRLQRQPEVANRDLVLDVGVASEQRRRADRGAEIVFDDIGRPHFDRVSGASVASEPTLTFEPPDHTVVGMRRAMVARQFVKPCSGPGNVGHIEPLDVGDAAAAPRAD